MNTHPTCERCHMIDRERFGGYQMSYILNREIYTCFDCTSICDYCHTSPSVILRCNHPVKYACMNCYDSKIE